MKKIAVVGVGSENLELTALELAAIRHNVEIVVVDVQDAPIDFPTKLEVPKTFELKSYLTLAYERDYNQNPRSKKRKRPKPR